MIVQDLDRALLQAPVMRLRLAAETTDWDAALRRAGGGRVEDGTGQRRRRGPRGAALPVPARPLHAAVEAVVEASDGEIRIFV